MKIKNILLIVVGILLGSVSVYAITVKSNNVTFTPKDTEWNVSDVESALNDLNQTVSGIKTSVIEIEPLYYKGEYFSEFTKYDNNNSSKGAITNNEDSIYFSTFNNSGGNYISTYTTYVDLTDIDLIYAHTVSANNGYQAALVVSEHPGCYNYAADTYGDINSVSIKQSMNGGNDFYSNMIDVKNLTGKYYVGIRLQGYNGVSSVTVDEIIMLKNVFQEIDSLE